MSLTFTSWVIVVSILTDVTPASSVVALTGTVSRLDFANVVQGTGQVTLASFKIKYSIKMHKFCRMMMYKDILLTSTLGIVVVLFGAVFTVKSSKVFLARTLSIRGLAVVANRAVEMTLARSAVGVAEVAVAAVVAIGRLEFGSALALSGRLEAVFGVEIFVTVTSCGCRNSS